jgi:hypothetical protein
VRGAVERYRRSSLQEARLVELMLQSRASVAADVPAMARDSYRTALFIEVEDLAPIRRAVAGLPALFEERTTFYGAREVGVRDPEGNPILFAQFEKPAKP